MEGPIDRPRKQYPSLRRGLLKLHRDLLTIHDRIDYAVASFPRELTMLERCVLTLEDRRFFKHMGVDWIRIIRETLKACVRMKHGGASTIDMQFVRTATGYKTRSLKRKIYECMLSYIIQHKYSKIVILRSYLGIAYFGTGLSGHNTASFQIFECHPDSLTLDQAADLASMLVFPKPRNPSDEWLRKHSRRSNYIKFVYRRRQSHFDKIEERVFV